MSDTDTGRRKTLTHWLGMAKRSRANEDGKAKGKKEGGKNDDANYDIGLQDVGDGSGIVTRFPPEPS